MFSQCEWRALSPDFLPQLSSSSMPFCLIQLHITTEDAYNKLVEKKNIILAYGLGNFNTLSIGPNPLEPKVHLRGNSGQGEPGTQKRERRGTSSIPSRGYWSDLRTSFLLGSTP